MPFSTESSSAPAGAPIAAGNALIGEVRIQDGTTGSFAAVQQFHNTDNQSPGGTAYGLLTGGVAQLINNLGNLDRQRETGFDNVSAVGVATSAQQFVMYYTTNSGAGVVAAPGVVTITPAAMAGTIAGVPWSIKVGTTMIIDLGVKQELVTVTAVTATTFTATFAQTHSAGFTIVGATYNQERDAAGELDGATGAGTAVAAEYEYNGGGPLGTQGFSFDRARSLQAKGQGASTFNGAVAAGVSTITLAAVVGLQAGMSLLLDVGTGTQETVYVANNYVPGTLAVPLAFATQQAHANGAVANWDMYAANGPGLAGFTCIGVGIEEEALYDPVSKLYYVERAATQDAMPAQNIVAESPALWNGATMDRMKGHTGSALFAQGNASALNLTAATVVKAIAGRVVRVNVIVAGTAVGTVNDCATTGAAAAANQTFSVPNTVGSYLLDFPHATGVVVVPGTGQTVAVSYV